MGLQWHASRLHEAGAVRADGDSARLVLSGINHGPNLGTDVFCSGTVAAAMEGTLEGLPAMAVSSACFQWRQFEGAGELALDVAESALRDGWPENLLLNLNLPPCRPETMGPSVLDTLVGSSLRRTVQPSPGSAWPHVLLACRGGCGRSRGRR